LTDSTVRCVMIDQASHIVRLTGVFAGESSYLEGLNRQPM